MEMSLRALLGRTTRWSSSDLCRGDKPAELRAITGQDPAEAAALLEAAGGNLELALSLYFDGGGVAAPPPPAAPATGVVGARLGRGLRRAARRVDATAPRVRRRRDARARARAAREMLGAERAPDEAGGDVAEGRRVERERERRVEPVLEQVGGRGGEEDGEVAAVLGLLGGECTITIGQAAAACARRTSSASASPAASRHVSLDR